MKYYKNLIKRKKHFAIILSLFFSIIGIAAIYFNSVQVIIDGIKESGLSDFSSFNNGIIGLLGMTNFGMIFIGVLTLYLGIIFIPRNAHGSQDDSDYFVESQEDMIYIKYKNREFLVKKETFEPTDLFFKDKNKKFVSMTTGYQIYNYVMMNHHALTEKEIDNTNAIKAEELYQKFSNVHIMRIEDKQKYLTYKKINNEIRPFFLILAIVLGLTTVLMIFGSISEIFLENITKEIIIDLIIYIVIIISLYIFTKLSYKASLKNKETFKKIMNSNMYYVSCYSYDKKTITSQDTEGYVNVNYYIKVTDKKHVLNQWIEIPKNIYLSNEEINVWLVFDETGKSTLEIVGLV